MKKSVIASPIVVITTIIVYALLAPIFFEIDNAYGVVANFVDDDKTMMYSQQQQVNAECKSPCPSSGEMCIEMCA